jgi:eukaryotic-like serine/threonine-protein kinase
MALSRGHRIGPYEIVAPIGSGGMGEVYRARDARLHRDVAIKLLPDQFAHDPERLARFTREAQTLAALNHPHIAQIYGVEESGSVRAIVMEFADGEDLSTRIARGPIPVADALPLARQIADALDAAHEHGIVHRDLKPANVMLTANGIKVLDFGLAKLVPQAGASEGSSVPGSSTPTIPATEMGTILGTAAYMAPEQAQGKVADKRADIWAFGVLLFEMLSGRRAFAGQSTAEILASVIRDAPDWTTLPIDVPPSVRRVLAGCLEKDPKQRLRDIGDARVELDQSHANDAERHPAKERRRISLWVAGAVLFATVSIGMAVAYALRSRPVAQPGPRRATIEVGALGDSRTFAFPVTVSTDGSLLVYLTSGRAAGGPLYARTLGTFASRPIEGTTGAVSPFLSPDARTVGFEREGEIFSVPVAGGPVVHAKGSAHLPEGRAAWMADGRIVFTSSNGGLMAMNPDGSSVQTLTTPARGERHLTPDPLPNGRAIIFTAVPGDPNEARIAAVSLADRGVRTLIEGGAVTGQYADGFIVYARPDRRLMAVPFDPERVEVSGRPYSLPDHVSRSRFGVAYFSVAAGLLVYLPPALTRLVEIDRKAGIETLEPDGLWHHPRYSPDGTRIVVDVTGDAGERDVWIYDRAAKTLSRVTRIGDAHDPSWLPDARSISFFSFKSGRFPLLIAPADGASPPEPLPIGDGFSAMDLVNPGGWTPDGTAYVGGVKDHGAPGDLWLLPHSKGAPVKIVGSSADELSPAISADGKWIAYQSDETGRGEIYVRALDGRGGRAQVSNAGGSEPVWDRKEPVLYYLESDGTRNRLMAAELRTSPILATVARTMLLPDLRLEEADNHANYDIHPSGARFVMPALQAPMGLQAVFDWAASFSSEERDR